MNILKNEIRARARLSRGILSILKEDIDMINIDVDSFNIYTINESITEATNTIMDLIENLIAMEKAVNTIKDSSK